MVWNKHKWFALIALIVAFAAYLSVLKRNANERELRTSQVSAGEIAGDSVRIYVTVTGVNPSARQLTAQLMFRVAGNKRGTPDTHTNAIGFTTAFYFHRRGATY
jgi:hypothetical protein